MPLSHWTGKETRTYAYAARGVVTSASTPDVRQEFRYAALGRRTVIGDHLIGQSDPVTVTTAYDPLSRITSATQLVGGVAETVGYGRDAAGRQTTLTYPSGRTIAYGYTPRHELHTVSESGAVQATYTYNPDGWLRLVDMATTTPIQLRRTPDEAGRLWSVAYAPLSANVLLDVNYGMNRRGERTRKSVTNEWPMTTTENYAYDGVGRLFTMTNPDMGSMVNEYDDVGNRTSYYTAGEGSYIVR